MRKVYVEVKVKLIMEVEEGTEIGDVIDNMDYNFTADNDGNATIVDTEILDHEVTDSK